MRYHDILYGEWELPEFLKKIVQTKEMVRLRGITQSALPSGMIPIGIIPSRFHHGLGVAYLASKVLEKNPHLSDCGMLMRVAALLHDAGNPPFSHLSEPFLKAATGMDGESFLSEILAGGETEAILKDYDLSLERVVKFVTGQEKTLSDVLNGSMDIDNLDNIARYAYATGQKRSKYNGVKIASAFRYIGGEWRLDDGAGKEAEKWQAAREKVYGSIYNEPHLNAAMMLYRAVALAFANGEIRKDFFFLNDEAAIAYLLEAHNPATQELIRRASRWDWYAKVFSFDTNAPSDAVLGLTGAWNGRTVLADFVAKALGVSKEKVCAYAGKGRDRRVISMRLVSGRAIGKSAAETLHLHRIRIYLAPECAHRAKEVFEMMSGLIKTPLA